MAANVISSQSSPLQMAKEMDKIYRVNLAESPTEYDKVCKIETAPAGPYTSQGEITGIGLPETVAEGAGVYYDMPTEGNVIRRNYEQSGLGYIITDIMLKDELFGMMKKLPADLARSMRIYSDIKALELYNDAENATTVGKDSVALCNSTGHALLNDVMNYGTYYNIPTTAGDLSETTFKAALEYYDDVVDENGYKLRLDPSQLICSTKDKYIAHRLHTQMYGGSSDAAGLIQTGTDPEVGNMMNLANPQNGFVNGWSIFDSRYLEDDRWFLMSADHDVKFYWKEQPKQTSMYDFDTDNLKFKAKQRFGVWCNEYRGMFGNITGNDQA